MSRQWNEQELEALVYGELGEARAAELERIAAEDADCARELALLRSERALMARRSERDSDRANDVADLWSGIAQQLAEQSNGPAPAGWFQRLFAGRAQGFGLGVAAAGLAAIALLFVTGESPHSTGQSTSRDVAIGGGLTDGAPEEPSVPGPAADDPGADPTTDPGAGDDLLDEASVALAQAEMAHLQALDALEKAYQAQRDDMDPDLVAQYDLEFAAARKSIEAAQAGGDLHARRRLLSAYSQQVMKLQAAVFDVQEPNP